MAIQVAVADLRISDRTAEKLRDDHDLDPDDVREAVEDVPGLQGKADFDPDRGWRIILVVQVKDEACRIVLYPTDDDAVWHLGSAYPV